MDGGQKIPFVAAARVGGSLGYLGGINDEGEISGLSESTHGEYRVVRLRPLIIPKSLEIQHSFFGGGVVTPHPDPAEKRLVVRTNRSFTARIEFNQQAPTYAASDHRRLEARMFSTFGQPVRDICCGTQVSINSGADIAIFQGGIVQDGDAFDYLPATIGVELNGVARKVRVLLRPGKEFSCDDGIDNDGDGLIDRDDPDCDVEICDNGVDDNENGLVDCDESSCGLWKCGDGFYCLPKDGMPEGCFHGLSGCEFVCRRPEKETICTNVSQYDREAECPDQCRNKKDDDGDGDVDCADIDCLGALCGHPDNPGYCGIEGCVETICNDKIDNDDDRDTDCADYDCDGKDCSMPGTPAGGAACVRPDCIELACDDQLDNDDDGLIDCFDPDCRGKFCRDLEGSEGVCGDGVCLSCDSCPSAACDGMPCQGGAGICQTGVCI